MSIEFILQYLCVFAKYTLLFTWDLLQGLKVYLKYIVYLQTDVASPGDLVRLVQHHPGGGLQGHLQVRYHRPSILLFVELISNQCCGPGMTFFCYPDPIFRWFRILHEFFLVSSSCKCVRSHTTTM